MGDYVTARDVLDLRAVSITGVDESTVDLLIDGIEAHINAVLKAQGYPTVPATGAHDVAMIRGYVLKKAAADAYLSARGSDDLPAWIEAWLTEVQQWLDWLVEGTVLLEDQAAVHPGRKARRHFIRVLPKVED